MLFSTHTYKTLVFCVVLPTHKLLPGEYPWDKGACIVSSDHAHPHTKGTLEAVQAKRWGIPKAFCTPATSYSSYRAGTKVRLPRLHLSTKCLRLCQLTDESAPSTGGKEQMGDFAPDLGISGDLGWPIVVMAHKWLLPKTYLFMLKPQ